MESASYGPSRELDVQLGEARAYWASQGWNVDEQRVFIEDAVSRAEFVKRPGLTRQGVTSMEVYWPGEYHRENVQRVA